MTLAYLVIYISMFSAALGQVLLKKGSVSVGLNLIILRINSWVVAGLGCMVLSMGLNLKALRVVPLRDMAFVLPTVYILVPLFSRVFLKENLNRRVLFGTGIIIMGSILFNIPLIRLF